jgi:hypothetical protein
MVSGMRPNVSRAFAADSATAAGSVQPRAGTTSRLRREITSAESEKFIRSLFLPNMRKEVFLRYKRQHFFKNFFHYIVWGCRDQLGLPPPPVHAFDLIGENDSRNISIGGQVHLEWISFYYIRYRTYKGKSGPAIVIAGRDHQCRTSAGLLMSDLWAKG